MDYIAVLHSGYEDRLTVKDLARGKTFKSLKDIFESFIDNREDVNTPWFLAVKGSSLKEEYTSTRNPSALTHNDILQDLQEMGEEECFQSHVCLGFVSLAEAMTQANILVQPLPWKKDFCFWKTFGFLDIHFKTSPSGRKYIIIHYDCESG